MSRMRKGESFTYFVIEDGKLARKEGTCVLDWANTCAGGCPNVLPEDSTEMFCESCKAWIESLPWTEEDEEALKQWDGH